ncbi:MAG TPA: 16S rRNA (guanine(966)-N(2))-methyltransferase RsmD [Lachnospiraceae bacterium]|nr:16S rRNA (guanine(966)-N(2))-methyltransferase RsmD [Lachnospiraceae bacterium]
MRVISGKARGHKLAAPEGLDTRPTTDRIKESLFNIIAPDIYDCEFLDLFSGSGSIGIEALSRGAKKAVFVDSGKKALEAIEYNLNHTKLIDNAKIIRTDVFAAIKMLGNENAKFDIIFMDPPYMSGLYKPTLMAILAADILNKDGCIIAEHPAKVELPVAEGFKIVRTKDYKKTVMSFWTLED